MVPMDVPALPHQHGACHADIMVEDRVLPFPRLSRLFLRKPCRLLDLHVPAKTEQKRVQRRRIDG